MHINSFIHIYIYRKKIAKTEIAPLICVVLFGAIATLNGWNAECCGDKVHAKQEDCPRCDAIICYDGTDLEGFFCGVEEYNVFGCNCDAGCRRNSKRCDRDEAIRLYYERYPWLTLGKKSFPYPSNVHRPIRIYTRIIERSFFSNKS